MNTYADVGPIPSELPISELFCDLYSTNERTSVSPTPPLEGADQAGCADDGEQPRRGLTRSRVGVGPVNYRNPADVNSYTLAPVIEEI